jgi:hypothetical protein
MMHVLSQWSRTVVAAAVLLALPTYAVCSLLGGAPASAGEVVLADGDDTVHFGLGVVTPPVGSEANATKTTTDSDIVLLTDWTFTSKGSPSPYR